ncbi:MAG: hypothetical protein ACFB6S_10430 [Geminicoccaceae bacterium]
MIVRVGRWSTAIFSSAVMAMSFTGCTSIAEEQNHPQAFELSEAQLDQISAAGAAVNIGAIAAAQGEDARIKAYTIGLSTNQFGRNRAFGIGVAFARGMEPSADASAITQADGQVVESRVIRNVITTPNLSFAVVRAFSFAEGRKN